MRNLISFLLTLLFISFCYSPSSAQSNKENETLAKDQSVAALLDEAKNLSSKGYQIQCQELLDLVEIKLEQSPNPIQEAQKELLETLVQHRIGNLNVATEKFNQLVKRTARDTSLTEIHKEALFHLLECYLKQDVISEGKKVMETILELNYDQSSNYFLARTYLNQGKIMLQEGDVSAAEALFENAYQLFDSTMYTLQVSYHLKKASMYATQSETEKGYKHVDTAYTLSIISQNKRSEISTKILEAYYLRIDGKLDSAIAVIDSTMKIANEIKSIYSINGLDVQKSTCYFNMLQYDSAYAIAWRAKNVANEKQFNQNLFSLYYLLGSISYRMSERERAFHEMDSACIVAQEIGVKKLMVIGLLGRGSMKASMNEYDAAKKDFFEADKMAGSLKDYDQSLDCKKRLSFLYYYLKEPALSGEYAEEGIALIKQHNITNIGASHFYRMAGQAYEDIDPDKSIRYLKEARNLNKKFNDVYINKSTLIFLAKIYAKKGNYENAFNYQKQLTQFNDSISKLETKEKLEEVKSQLEAEQKDKTILSLKNEKEIQALTVSNQEAEITAQKQLLALVILIALLVAGSIVFVFNQRQVRQKTEKLDLQTQQLALERKQEKTKQQLQLAELRTDFFTNISHEFRTPLTLIIGPLETMLERENSNKKEIEPIYKSATHLLSLINETLDLSKLSNGQLPLRATPVLVGDYVSQIMQSFQSIAQKNDISFSLKDNSNNASIDIDQGKFKQILNNLLGNAFKHTPTEGKIDIEITSPQEGNITIQVKDSGMGIDEDHLPHVFDRYYQGNSEVYGTGLGLTITKQLVELHKGTIDVSSQTEVGTTFSITLPLKQEQKEVIQANESFELTPTEEKTPASILEPQSKKSTVLIIEDNTDLRQYIKELLQEEYDILLAADGNEGIAIAEEKSPELIVSDVMMPFKDGFELTTHLKQNLPTSHIPIILLTAKASIDSKLEGLEKGADDYISKPFHPKELLQRCKNLIAQREQLRELFSNNYLITPKKITNNEVDETFINKAVQVVEAHIDNPSFTIEQFCKELAYNRSGVHQKLKALTGKNASGFVRLIRIRKAAKYIEETNYNMNEIATMTGFGSRQAFNKAFKEQFNLTPTEFRNSDGVIPLPETSNS